MRIHNPDAEKRKQGRRYKEHDKLETAPRCGVMTTALQVARTYFEAISKPTVRPRKQTYWANNEALDLYPVVEKHRLFDPSVSRASHLSRTSMAFECQSKDTRKKMVAMINVLSVLTITCTAKQAFEDDDDDDDDD